MKKFGLSQSGIDNPTLNSLMKVNPTLNSHSLEIVDDVGDCPSLEVTSSQICKGKAKSGSSSRIISKRKSNANSVGLPIVKN